MATERRRKPLRERVAARRAGLPEEEIVEQPDRKWRVWLSWIGLITQAVALILVLIEIVFLLERNFVGVSFTRLTIYIVVFFAGRVIQLALAMTRNR